MKKRGNEKRRMTRRRQKGGAVDNLDAWVAAVKASPMFAKTVDEAKPDAARSEPLRLGAYHFADLKRDELKLPDMKDDQETNFNINQYSSGGTPIDLRVEGAGLAIKWAPVTSANPTPAEFKDYINENMGADINVADPDFREAVNYLVEIENKLRHDSDPITSLTDDSKYPLFVWALLMNLPEKPVEAVPALISEEEVKTNLTRLGLSEPAKPVS